MKQDEAAVLAELRNPEGEGLLARLGETKAKDRASPAFVEGLRKDHSPELVRLALRVGEARLKAAAKFPRGGELYFTPELLEQSSAHPPALHRARRLAPHGRVLDLGCGAGGDLSRMALAGVRALGMERDALALAMARANLEVLGLEAETALGEFPCHAPPEHDALFADPARRESGRRPGGSGRKGRHDRAADFSPPPSSLGPLIRKARAWCVKWGPALDLSHEALSASDGPLAGLARQDYELELVSWKGELREAALWGGELERGRAAATVLEGGLEDFHTHRFEGDPDREPPPLGAPGEFIHEPDAALIRASLLNDFAHSHKLRLLAEQIAYLSSDAEVNGPFLRSYRRLESFPFSLARVQEALSRRRVGEVVLKKRGFPMAPEDLRRRLRLSGDASAVLIIHRSAAGHTAHLCEKR